MSDMLTTQPATQCFVFFARELTDTTFAVAEQLNQQVAPEYDFYILSYREGKALNALEQKFNDKFVIIDRATLSQNFQSFPLKYSDGDAWKIMPGNLDLVHLSFALKFKQYQHYWFCEDDVRFGGDISQLLSAFNNDDSDLLCTNFREIPKDWFYQNSYVNETDNNPVDRKLAFLPFFRISQAGINCFNQTYQQKVTGHHEITWPNILLQNSLKVNDINYLGKRFYTSNPKKMNMSRGSFCYFPPKLGHKKDSALLYHPVKPKQTFWALHKKFFKQKVVKTKRLLGRKLGLA